MENTAEVLMKERKILNGFSKKSKKEKLEIVAGFFDYPDAYAEELKTYWHRDIQKQKLFEEFSENIISNYFLPYSVVPNFIINNKVYFIPMVTEESSVVAAAANSAKFWADKGGFVARILSENKIGQVHFIWRGDKQKLKKHMPQMRHQLIKGSSYLTTNMEKRGGGIFDIELVDMTDKLKDYFQLKATFKTADAMGANFINSCLEQFSVDFKKHLYENDDFEGQEKECEVVMSILSNYTPDCLVECYVETDVQNFRHMDDHMTALEFVKKFEKAVRIAQVDPHRATTHNKGIYNGIDAVAIASGNDFRSIEACGHTFAARSGQYSSLTDISINNDVFRYILKVPLSMGTIGGLTGLHPLAKRSLELLDHPASGELASITAAVGLANNFGALRSLVTKGIQIGHMKMHLLNILNQLDATDEEKKAAVEYYKNHKVSFSNVKKFLVTERGHRKN